MPCPEENKWNASRQGGEQGWVSAGKIDFCYDYISKKHQEGGAIAWPLQCVTWPGIFRHEDSRRLFAHHGCPGIQLKNAVSQMMCQAKEISRSRIALKNPNRGPGGPVL